MKLRHEEAGGTAAATQQGDDAENKDRAALSPSFERAVSPTQRTLHRPRIGSRISSVAMDCQQHQKSDRAATEGAGTEGGSGRASRSNSPHHAEPLSCNSGSMSPRTYQSLSSLSPRNSANLSPRAQQSLSSLSSPSNTGSVSPRSQQNFSSIRNSGSLSPRKGLSSSTGTLDASDQQSGTVRGKMKIKGLLTAITPSRTRCVG